MNHFFFLKKKNKIGSWTFKGAQSTVPYQKKKKLQGIGKQIFD
jgi:hypothetical protein